MRILYLDVQAPVPDRQASSVRTYQLLSLLRERDFTIHFASLVRPERAQQAELMRALGIELLPWLGEEARRAFLVEHARKYGVIICAWTNVARRFIATARTAAPDTFLIFDSVDANHLREYREARLTGNQNTLRRALLSRARETEAMRVADCTLAISEDDAAVLRGLDSEVSVAVVTMWCEPRIRVIPSASTVLFLGHYGTGHNRDAAIHLARDIWPRIRAQRPQSRLVLAGSDPDPAITDLAETDISVPGWSPDLTALFSKSAVFAAPLRFGAGIKGKMLQAMAHGVPIVASAIAAEGIGLNDGKDYLCANSPDAMANAIVRLLNNSTLSQTLASNAYDLLGAKYTRRIVASQLDHVLTIVRDRSVRRDRIAPRPYARM